MKKKTNYFTAIIIAVLTISSQFTFAQIHTKKIAVSVNSAPTQENYISHIITKNGVGDHGLFTDTLSGKILPSDPVITVGKHFQDIHLILEAGDVIKATIWSNFNATLALFYTTNGKLTTIKTGTYSLSEFNMVYKAFASGSYTLRVVFDIKNWKDKNFMKYFYADSWYRMTCKIAIPQSALISDDAPFCDRIEFLLRHSETDFRQLEAAATDSTIEADKKKIDGVNYRSSFNIVKNSKAEISTGSSFSQFYESLYYSSIDKAQRIYETLIGKFKNCLGGSWKGGVVPDNLKWYDFTRDGYRTIHIIDDTSDKNIRILM